MTTAEPRFHRILVPSGLSEGEQEAFRLALRLCIEHRARMTLLHVGNESREEVPWDRFPHVRQTLEAWGLIKPGTDIGTVHQLLGITIEKRAVHEGEVTYGVRKYLHRHRTDLVVMMSAGRSAFQQLLAPSVAGVIVEMTQAPSLILPSGRSAPLREPDGVLELQRILLPVGRETHVDRALGLAADMAMRSCRPAVTITMLHVGSPGHWFDRLTPPTHTGIRWEREVCAGPVVETIAERAKVLDVELLVMATDGRDGLMDHVVGTTTERIRSVVSCPVLAVPTWREE